jgi:putative transposase
LIKTLFARQIPVRERRSKVRQARGERGLWQRRFWEHVIRSERDYAAHLDYVHYNPVKHGYAVRVADWPFSTFRRCVERGIYSPDWGGVGTGDLAVG